MSVYRLDMTFSRWLVERFAPPLVRVEINPYAHAGIWPHRGLRDNVELQLNRAGPKANLMRLSLRAAVEASTTGVPCG
jgi:hypothetical protein